MMMHPRAGQLAMVALISLCSGCATLPYRAGPPPRESERTLRLRPGEEQVVRGRPYAVLDASDWIWPGSWLGKLILWNARVDSHEISTNTEQVLEDYLAINELSNVKVRLNQYSPGDEWRRLFHNRAVGAGWRYTLGLFSVLNYTILPGRFFGGDHYNAYTDSINLYSDIPAVVVHEGGHAKDWGRRKYKGTHAFLYALPGAPLYYEAVATSDALGYLRETQPLALQKQGYNVLYPAYGTYVGGTLGQIIYDPYGLYAMGMVIPGHIVGRIKSARLSDAKPEGTVEPGVAPEAPAQEPPAQ